MTTYNVHIDREVRLVFEGIEADSHEEAAAIACDKHPAAAGDIDNCDGETFSAQVDVAGEQHPTVTIEFGSEQRRKAAAKLLAALKDLLGDRPSVQNFQCIRCGRDYHDIGEFAIETGDCPSDDCPSYRARAAIAEAEAAGIEPAPAVIDVHALLAGRRQIAAIWSVEDVESVRPDLTEDQCWEVLQTAKKYHDCEYGITWDTLLIHADDLFGAAPARPDTAGTEDA